MGVQRIGAGQFLIAVIVREGVSDKVGIGGGKLE